MTWNPSRIFIIIAIALSFSGCFGPPRHITHPPGVAIERDMVYATVGERELMLDLYTPENATGQLPCVVWIHGGGWVHGSRRLPPVAPIATRGYVLAAIEYRLVSDQTPWPAQLHDCKAAIRYLRANAEALHIDPDRIAALGISAGGHLASMLGTTAGLPQFEGDIGVHDQSSAVQAVIAYCPPVDMSTLYQDDVSWKMRYAIRALLDGEPDERPVLARNVSPLTWIDADDAPHLIIHGSEDMVVTVDQSEQLQSALRSAGVKAILHVIEGGGHGNRLAAYESAQMATNEFLDEQLELISQQ